MKSIKHLDIKNNKVLLGLFSLLFLLVTAQTAAILSTQDRMSQTGQVVSAPGCLTILHKYNMDESIFSDQNFYVFRMFYKVTNNCDYAIKIIDSMSLHNESPISTLKSAKIQVLGPTGNPISIPNLTTSQYGINVVAELVDCSQCENGAETNHSSTAVNDGQIQAISFLPGQTRSIVLALMLDVPDEPSYFFRAALYDLKWFRDSALSDGVVSQAEIFTKSLGSTLTSSSATDYMRIQHDPNYSGLMQEGTKDVIKETLTKEEIESQLKAQ